LVVSGDYGGPVRSALLAYKERGRRDLTDPLARALAAAVHRLVTDRAGRSPPPGAVGSRAMGPLLLVPVPSRPAAARARGGDHVLRLARACALLLPRQGLRAGVLGALRVGRPVRDSAGLSAAARAVNLAGAFSLTQAGRRVGRVARPVLIVVDDLVTTGATVAEACRVLAQGGLSVAGIAAVAGTPRSENSLPT
jgi:predicted amidophosphoribosyltransferase